MIVNESGFTFFKIVYKTASGWWATFAAKGLFEIQNDRVASFSIEAPPSGDEYADRENSLPVYDSDMAPYKPNAEVLMMGPCLAPEGQQIKKATLSLQLGGVRKMLVVFGDREWLKKTAGAMQMSEPASFSSMDVSYANAFGGTSFKFNPCGKGWYGKGKGKTPPEFISLPNVEDPQHLILSPKDAPMPAGFGPLNRMWPQRLNKTGSYDDKWLTERWPWFPDDFDWSYFNAAPIDQQIDGYFDGDEIFRVTNMHPQFPILEGRLPSLRVRCFVRRQNEAGFNFSEVTMNLDTIWIYPEHLQLILVWRGSLSVADEEMTDIKDILLSTEKMSETANDSVFYDNHLTAALDEEASAFDMTDDDPDEWSDEKLREEFLSILTPYEKELFLQAEERQAKLEADIRETLAKEGVDYDQIKARAKKEEPPSDDPEDVKKWAQEKEDDLKERIRKELKAEGIKVDLDNQKALDTPIEMLASFSLPDFRDNLLAAGIDDPEILNQIDGLSSLMADLDIDLDFFASMDRDKALRAIGKGEALKDRDLNGFDFSRLDLSGAVFDESTLEKSNFLEANLNGASLIDADLTESVLERANLSGAIMEDAMLINARLSGADLRRANLRDADLSGADLTGADLSQADITGADFSDAMLDDAVFEAAIGASATFSGAKGIGANFRNADLTESRADDETALPHADFATAVLIESCWSGADLCGSVFSKAVMDKSDFSACRLVAATFQEARLKETSMAKADLTHANMVRVNMFQGNLEKAILKDADLSGSNLYEVEFWEAQWQQANLSGANLKRTKLE